MVDGIDLRNDNDDNYIKLKKYFADYLSDSERIYVPFVAFISEGSVVHTNEGTLPTHDAKQREMTVEEVKLLKEIYENGFNFLRSE